MKRCLLLEIDGYYHEVLNQQLINKGLSIRPCTVDEWLAENPDGEITDPSDIDDLYILVP